MTLSDIHLSKNLGNEGPLLLSTPHLLCRLAADVMMLLAMGIYVLHLFREGVTLSFGDIRKVVYLCQFLRIALVAGGLFSGVVHQQVKAVTSFISGSSIGDASEVAEVIDSFRLNALHSKALSAFFQAGFYVVDVVSFLSLEYLATRLWMFMRDAVRIDDAPRGRRKHASR